jgi:hypothetical protein
MRGIYYLAEELLDSQEGLSSLERVVFVVFIFLPSEDTSSTWT